MVQQKAINLFVFPSITFKIIDMKGLCFLIFIFSKVSILDLPRHYAEQGDIESAIRAYNEIYRTSSDSIIKYQALFEQAELYLKVQDTISALSNLYRLSTRRLSDSLAIKVFDMLFQLDSSRLGKNVERFAYLYPNAPQRKKVLLKMLSKLKDKEDTSRYLAILRVLASDYDSEFKGKLSAFIYKNDVENKIFPSLFDANPWASYYYYMHRKDTFSAFYALFGKEDTLSRKLKLKILYNLGAYDAVSRMIKNDETDSQLVKMKIMSLVFMRQRADSIMQIAKFYKSHKKIYNSILYMLDTLKDYNLLKAYMDKNPNKALLNAKGASKGLRDTVFFKLAVFLTLKGQYAYAKDLLKDVKDYYPQDTVLLWKGYLEKQKKMPQDILLGGYDTKGMIKELFNNGYYAELVQYAKGKTLPAQVVPYIVESLYNLWQLYGREGDLKNAFLLAEKYSKLIPRKLYLKIVYHYNPSFFNIERYTYQHLDEEELYYLYYLLKSKHKEKLLKDLSHSNVARFLYHVSSHNIDSALFYLPNNQKFYTLLFEDTLSTKDSMRIYKKLSKRHIDYRRYPAKSILKHIIPIALRFNDFLITDTLLQTYKMHFGKDRFYAFYRAKLDYVLEDYKKSLLYGLFFNDDSFQSLCALSLLKMDNLEGISNLSLDKYAKNLLYLKSGMIEKVDPMLLDEQDIKVYLKELIKENENLQDLQHVLNLLVKRGKIDSVTYIAYGIYFGFLEPDSFYLSEYGKSLLRYLNVKRLMRMNKMDSALLLIGNPEDAVDSFKYHLYFKKGTILYLKKNYIKAYKNYLKSSDLESLKDAALFNAYLSAKRANKNDLVIKTLKRYIHECIKCDKLSDAYISLGFTYIELGRPDTAVDVLKRVEGYFDRSDEAELKYWLGMAYMQDSLFQESLGYFLRVYKFHRKNGDWGDTGGLNAARLYYMLGLKQDAKRIYIDIIRRRGKDAIGMEAKKEVLLLK